MANTTNFNWETPDDTDLVKDGAAAIRTLGSAIDTSLVDLKGGTTGQVLSKATNTDMDFTWVAQDDSNAIQNAIIDAKGDLIVGASNDTPARLAIGTNNYVLTADSTATNGVKWAAVPSSSPAFVGVSLSQTSAPTLSNNTDTILLFDTEVFDTDGFHSTTTDTGNITIPAGKAGYLITAAGQFAANSTGRRQINLNFQPGGTKATAEVSATTSAVPTATISFVKDMAVGDYVRLIAWQNSGGSLNMESITFQATYLGA